MKLYCQREFSSKCFGEIIKKRIFYSWHFCLPKQEKPIAKGVSFTFWGAVKKCNYFNNLYVGEFISKWKMF
jgi:hypothetical protein